MGHKHRSSGADFFAHVRAERGRPWTWLLDGGLVLGAPVWIALRSTMAPHPQVFAIYSAVLVGTIVHRIFRLMDGQST